MSAFALAVLLTAVLLLVRTRELVVGAVLRWAPPLLAAVVMVAALWVSAAAMSAVAVDLGVAAGYGLVAAPPAFVPVVAVDGTILAATAVAVARRTGRGWHRPALGAGGAALALSMALNVTHVLAARAALPAAPLLALAVIFSALFPVAAAVTLHLALDGLAPDHANRTTGAAPRADLAPAASRGAGARARVRAVLAAQDAAGGDPAGLTGAQVAAAAGCSLRRAQELLAELRAPTPVSTPSDNGSAPSDELERRRQR